MPLVGLKVRTNGEHRGREMGPWAAGVGRG